MTTYKILTGDSREVLGTIAGESIDACVCDPPYELNFMGKKWDGTGIAYSVELWREVLRVLKPGGHLLAFGGTRTYHRMTCVIEDAGFEIRDCLMWLYGQGFPKSLDVSKAIDKTAGAEREVVGYDASRARPNRTYEGGAIGNIGGTGKASDRTDNGATITAPATDAAKQWDGWGTALKPAYEPIILARKPLEGTVAANVQRWGTGAINIDASRIAHASANDLAESLAKNPGRDDKIEATGIYGSNRSQQKVNIIDRWPANVLLDEEAGALLDEQSGISTSPGETGRGAGGQKGKFNPIQAQGTVSCPSDTGGASRFFYTAKTSTAEREAGLATFPRKTAGELTDREDGTDGLNSPRAGAGRSSNGRANVHPTVKPISLMRYLVRLIAPPGGIVLDPFTGSGSTGCAAIAEGFGFTGIELDPAYAEIARARMEKARSEGHQLNLGIGVTP